MSWEVMVSGSKNATLPILWAALLLRWKVRLKGVPKIGDVVTLLEIIEDIWVVYEFVSCDDGTNDLLLDSTDLHPGSLDYEKIKKIRSSIFLLSPLLHFFGSITMPFPGGCSIWKRPIDAHLNGLEAIGYKNTVHDENISLEWKLESWDRVLNAWFWVWSTENLLIANVLRKGKTMIHCVATEPHVMSLVAFLRKWGANIKIRYNHTIVI